MKEASSPEAGRVMEGGRKEGGKERGKERERRESEQHASSNLRLISIEAAAA